MTDFQRKVYAALMAIPRGRVVTYKILAGMVGCGSCRAIGQALRRNPDAPRVPCHRVIASDLRLGGYAGAVSGAPAARKLRLLAAEGVKFEKGRLVDPSRVVTC
ncbi:MAG: MGMT family protein [Lentisphaerae bacterium]|nr:MGMT family protein [Lentisphaerota bacterium]